MDKTNKPSYYTTTIKLEDFARLLHLPDGVHLHRVVTELKSTGAVVEINIMTAGDWDEDSHRAWYAWLKEQIAEAP